MKKKAFTLVELVIVITLLGILAVSVLPRFVDFRGSAERAVARHFFGALQEAHNLYLARLILEERPPTLAHGFMRFVAGSETGGSPRNTIAIEDSLRKLLVNGGDNLVDDSQIQFIFKGGGTATYTINTSTGRMSASFVGF